MTENNVNIATYLPVGVMMWWCSKTCFCDLVNAEESQWLPLFLDTPTTRLKCIDTFGFQWTLSRLLGLRFFSRSPRFSQVLVATTITTIITTAATWGSSTRNKNIREYILFLAWDETAFGSFVDDVTQFCRLSSGDVFHFADYYASVNEHDCEKGLL